MIHETLEVGAFQCNCHILGDEKTREAVIIDPGDQPEEILEAVRQLGVTVKALIHTHGHLDHIMGTRVVKEATGAEILLHQGDSPLYENVADQARFFGWSEKAPFKVDRYLKDGDVLEVGSLRFEVLHTPGHTPGSCCLCLQGSAPVVFSGDTLFARSIGRTDLWGGNYDQEIASIQTKLMPLGDDILVFPGHGPKTKIGEERRKNPFLIG